MEEVTGSKKLKPTSIEAAEYARTIWEVTPAEGVTVEDMLKEDYWSHVAGKLKAGQRIEAIPEDRSFFAEFIVIGCDRLWAKVALLREVDIYSTEGAVTDDKYKIGFAGKHKWRVTRGQDVLSKGHDDRQTAEQWLKEYKEKMAA